MDKRLTHSHPAHFTYAFVMPVAQARDGLSREAPRFAPIQQHRQNTTSVNLVLEAFMVYGFEGGAGPPPSTSRHSPFFRK